MPPTNSSQLFEWFFIVDRSYPLASWILAMVAFRVGRWMISEHPKAERLGGFLAVSAFVFYVGHTAYYSIEVRSWALVDILYRGGLTGCIVLGFSWMALAPLTTVYRVLLYKWIDIKVAFIVGRRKRKMEREQAEREKRYLEDEKRRIELENRPETPFERDYRLECEKQAVLQREEDRKEEIKRSDLESLKEKIRFEANLLHKRLINPKKTSFKRKDFDDLLSRVLKGNDAELIEQRAGEMMQSLSGFSLAPVSKAHSRPIPEIAADSQKQRDEVNAMTGITDEDREYLITQINRRESQQLHSTLRSL